MNWIDKAVAAPCPELSPLYHESGMPCCEDHCRHEYHQEYACLDCGGIGGLVPALRYWCHSSLHISGNGDGRIIYSKTIPMPPEVLALPDWNKMTLTNCRTIDRKDWRTDRWVAACKGGCEGRGWCPVEPIVRRAVMEEWIAQKGWRLHSWRTGGLVQIGIWLGERILAQTEDPDWDEALAHSILQAWDVYSQMAHEVS